jgi:DNA-binding response OmpR family regulator
VIETPAIVAGLRVKRRPAGKALTRGEGRVLALLIENGAMISTYRALYDAYTGNPGLYAGQGDDGMRVNVRQAITRLRRKTGTQHIEAQPGIGYRWLP